MTKNLEVATAAAEEYVASEHIESYDAEEGSDVLDIFDSVDFPEDTLFTFGENSQIIVLVKDGVVVGEAVGGFEDNRGMEIEGEYRKPSGELLTFLNTNEDPEKGYEEVYKKILAWLEN